MLMLALRMLRHRIGSAVATLVALTCGVMILMSMGVLVESGMRYAPAPQRYAAADILVAKRDMTITTQEFGETVTATVVLPEGATVPADLADHIGQLPGVAVAAADRSIPAVVPIQSVAPGQPAAQEAVAHGWSSAALTPYRIVDGTQPDTTDEVAIDVRLATAAGDQLRTGDQLPVLAGGAVRQYRVSGIVERTAAGDGPSALFFTDDHAAALSPDPDRAGLIGIVLAPGADTAAVTAEVSRLAAESGATVHTGAERGKLEQSEGLAAATLLTQLGAVFGGYVAGLVMFVVAGTIGLAVRHRRRDLALLRAVAATPGQVRLMIVAEVAQLSIVSALLGVPAGLWVTGWVHGQLMTRGFIPDGFPLDGGVLSAVAVSVATVLVAVSAGLIAARRTVKIRPTEALGEVAVEPARSSRVRLVAGLVAVGGGVALTMFTTAVRGQAALGAATGMLFVFVLAAALLAPWINRYAAQVLGPVLRAVWGDSGYLAAANLRANAQGMATVLTALVLSVGFGGSVWFLQDNLERESVAQTRDGMLAQHALVSAVGLPASAVVDAREVPGVVAATGIRRTSVLVPMMDAAEPVAAQAIDPDGADQTLDLSVTEGSLADLRGDTVALSTLQASSQGADLGDQVEFWLGDGTPVSLRLVAIYERGLAYGDVTLHRETVDGHTPTNLDEQVLIRTAPGDGEIFAGLAGLVERYPGSGLIDTGAIDAQLATDLALSAWLNKLLIGVMVGYAALAAANTMIMAALARGRELALLRLVGVTTRQVKRMVHAEQVGLLGTSLLIGGAIAAVTLVSVVRTMTGQLIPYVPPLGWVSIIGGTTLLALVTTIAPISALLRTPPVDSIGVKE
ncbi:ABC transporter permease [Micromonospora sp. NBC_01813]|uniref:ABC transporter permease n=1 Tax=Micromonospora sp. NBC_01813 TaxID=2975988 RepID=UPI002DDBDAB4|nr:ABC transporter permease [Micromonospora sp. NBC_01813]WSA07824.1 ABC transporter permease [Micromonospora sp. NBC_01813]